MVDFKLLIGIRSKKRCRKQTTGSAAEQATCAAPCAGNCVGPQQVKLPEETPCNARVLKSDRAAYEVLSLLGEGVYGKVMKCREVGSKTFVAVKMLKSSPSFKEAAMREAQLLWQLSRGACCEHVVRCVEWFLHGGCTCIVLELLGRTLGDAATPPPLPLAATRRVLGQLLSALAHLQALGIVHADLKPDNIMVASDAAGGPMRVKIIDFSCAVPAADAGLSASGYAQSRWYRAPEVLLRGGLRAPADVWSLGCVGAELLLGCALFPGAGEFDQLRLICAAHGPPRASALRLPSARLYFRPSEDHDEGATLELRTPQEVEALTGERPQLNLHTPPLCSLEELGPRHLSALARARAPARPSPRALTLCVGLLKEMLAFDQVIRIRPVEALAHPFLVLDFPMEEDLSPEGYSDTEPHPTDDWLRTEESTKRTT